LSENSYLLAIPETRGIALKM